MQTFISYFPEDAETKRRIETLSARLNGGGVRTVATNLYLLFPRGIEVYDELPKAIGNCDRVVIVLSKPYVESDWHMKELMAFFLMAERLKKRDWLLPVVIDDCRVPGFLTAPPLPLAGESDAEFAALLAAVFRPPRVFFVSKFGDAEVDAIYDVAREAFRRAGFVCQRIDLVRNAGKIPEQIVSEIHKSEVVFVDFTDNRPNCYYEAGYADALEKEVIFAARKDTVIHFDLRDRRRITWEATELDVFRAKLQPYIDEVAGMFVRPSALPVEPTGPAALRLTDVGGRPAETPADAALVLAAFHAGTRSQPVPPSSPPPADDESPFPLRNDQVPTVPLVDSSFEG